MRIDQLKLLAYGPFTDVLLDLSEGDAGLHMIYGPNEAGKSSSLRAIHALLFGMGQQNKDSFLHPYNRMRLGGVLQNGDGHVLEFVRRKGRQATLRDGADQNPLADDALRPFLQGLDAEAFNAMFGIDHQTLRKGGEEIVCGRGQIGELLFSAGAGLSGLQALQKQMQDQLDELFKAGGQKPRINSTIKDYHEALGNLKRQTLPPEEWLQHDRALTQAQAALLRLDQRIAELQCELARRTRLRDVLPIIGRWKRAVAERDACPVAPHLPADFTARREKAMSELQAARRQDALALEDLSRLEIELAKLSVDTALLSEAENMTEFQQLLGSYRKAQRDRLELETRKRAAEQAITDLLGELGRPPQLSRIETILIPADRQVRIQNLGNQHEGVLARRENAHRDRQQLVRLLEKTETRLRELESLRDPRPLREAVREIQALGDLEQETERIHLAVQALEQELLVAAARLPLWSGPWEQLERLPVPTEEMLDRCGKDEQHWRRLLEERTKAKTQTEQSLQDLQRELDEGERTQAVPTEEDLKAARQQRDHGWSLIVAAWQHGRDVRSEAAAYGAAFPQASDLASAYAQSVSVSDQLADRLRREASQVARKAQLQATTQQLKLQLAEQDQEITAALALGQQWQEQWVQLWQPCRIAPLSVAEMRSWLRQQRALRERSGELRTQQREAERRRDQLAQARQRLLELAADFQLPPATARDRLPVLLERAADRADELRRQGDERKGLLQQQRELRDKQADQERSCDEADRALAQWQLAWADEMRQLQLSPEADPSQANVVLTKINELVKRHQEINNLTLRLEGIDRDADEFKQQVADLARRLAPDLLNHSVDEAVTTLDRRCKEARAGADRQKQLLQQQKQQLQRRQDAQEAIGHWTTELTAMCKQAECPQFDDLPAVEARAHEWREREGRVRDLENQLCEQSAGQAPAAYVEAVESEVGDPDSLGPRIEQLQAETQQLQAERDSVLRTIEREEQELARMDGREEAAEAAERCEQIAARVEDDVHRFTVLRIAQAMLRTGVERYREKNQGPVLERSGRLFAELTLGSFRGLAVDLDERGQPVLRGLRGDKNEPVPVDGMSEGTRDQLYLALRLASLEAWLDHHPPIPFIVDDILMNFDDERAAAALRVLGELSHRTQVLVFTHHAHVLELAQRELSSEVLFTHCLGNQPAASAS